MKLNRILEITVVFLLVLIITGTAVAFITKTAKPGDGIRTADPTAETFAAQEKNKGVNAAFNELGKLRLATKSEDGNKDGVTLVVLPWLSYKEDKEFYEELYKKRQTIKSEFTAYFTSHTKKELDELGEDRVKAELMDNINQKLSLGKITRVYFTDYIFFE